MQHKIVFTRINATQLPLMYKINILYCILCYSSILFSQEYRWSPIESNDEKLTSGKYHAIIISENEYLDENINDLEEPKKDADRLHALLSSKYFFNEHDILRLTDPTRTEIIDAIEMKRKNAVS